MEGRGGRPPERVRYAEGVEVEREKIPEKKPELQPVKPEKLGEMIGQSCSDKNIKPGFLASSAYIPSNRVAGILGGWILPGKVTLSAMAEVLSWSDEERRKAIELLSKELNDFMEVGGYIELHQ